MDDAFLAHAIIEPRAAVGGDQPATQAAKALGVQALGVVHERTTSRTLRARAPDGKQLALVVVADSATTAERERFAAGADRLCSSGGIPGTVRVHAVAPSRDAFLADLWTTGCATDLPTLQWSSRRRLEFVRRVTQALDLLHRAGIVHGALCPQNVLLDDNLQPVIAEAGMVSVHLLLERHADVSGYSESAAPEVKRGEEPDVRSDVWSAGCLLEQLVGEKEVPEVADVLRRCLAPLANLRYASAGELAAAIDAVIAALPAGNRVNRPVSPPPERMRVRTSEPGVIASRWAIDGRMLRRVAASGAAFVVVAPVLSFFLGARTSFHDVLGAMIVVGTAMATLAIPALPSAPVASRAMFALSFGAYAMMLDPLSVGLRARAVWQLQGDSASRRAAVAEIVERGRDFRGLSLVGLDLSALDLTGADFRRADLSHADLSSARLWSAQLQGACLEGARLVRTNLEETALGEALNVGSAQCDAGTRLPGTWRCVRGKLSRE
jgi:hypothetical protein